MSQVQTLPTMSTATTVYIVTRHHGAVEWLSRRGFVGKPMAHLDTNIPQPGDVVVGVLPPNLIAELNGRGIGFYNLGIRLPDSLRGQELSADQMEGLSPTLQFCEVRMGEVIA